MSEEVRNLEPTGVWGNFADLNAVPRPSKKEERVIEFMVNFGKSLNLDTQTDASGNVVIKKPATPGMEDRKTVILQNHLDMVHQKNNDTQFDFDRQGIEMYVDGDWVRARGTTLGADNGLGVSMAMEVLASKDFAHPAIEALFTIDEETGMTGAKELDKNILSGEILINIDTEDDDEITIGCAGGVDTTVTGVYSEQEPVGGGVGVRVTLNGLQGGHSGMDINNGLGNANKLMNRFLLQAVEEHDFQIHDINGGGLRNAIPRESVVTGVVADQDAFQKFVSSFESVLRDEYKNVEPGLKLSAVPCELPNTVMVKSDALKFLKAVYACPNGVYRMNPDMPDLVETSTNLARVELAGGKLTTLSLQRSSVETQKADVAAAVRCAFEQAGYEVEHSGDYPGWQPDVESDIKDIMSGLYEEMFNEKPKVMACHAGLECGIIGTRYPGLEMISFGPTIKGAHSPDERASISSLKKSRNLLLETLKRIPKK